MRFDLSEADAEDIAEYADTAAYEGPIVDFEYSNDWDRVNGPNTSSEEMLDNMVNTLKFQLLRDKGYDEQVEELKENWSSPPKDHVNAPIYRFGTAELDGELYITASFANRHAEEGRLFSGGVVYDGKPKSSRTEISHRASSVISNLNQNPEVETVPEMEERDTDYFVPEEDGAVRADTRVGPHMGLGQVAVSLNFEQEKWDETVRRLEEDIPQKAATLEDKMRRIS